MKKLIELLNEYEKEKSEKFWRWNYVWCIDKEHKSIFASRFPDWAYICEDESRAVIISKGYNFIKRLVKNKKINFSIIPNKIKEIWIPMKINWEIKYWFDSSDYYWLLMLLSIQDNPIEFLCSILK